MDAANFSVCLGDQPLPPVGLSCRRRWLNPTPSAEELNLVKAALKGRYREKPTVALATLEAEGELDEGNACSVQTGLPSCNRSSQATPGDGTATCSGDMLLRLWSLRGSDLEIGKQRHWDQVSGSVRAKGDLDWRRTSRPTRRRGRLHGDSPQLRSR